MRLLASSLALLAAAAAQADTVILGTVADNTMIEDPEGAWSLGAAYNFYAGRVGTSGGSTLRRGLIRFDLSAIPAGSTITSASLKLNLSATQAGTFTVSLHRCLASWGEGTSFAFGGGGAPSTAGDATWLHRFWPGTPWELPGGEFALLPSASRSVGGVGFYTWGSTAGMVADVQAWLNAPAANFGWTVVGNEVTLQSVKRFDAKESTVASTRPALTIVFTPPPAPVPGDLDHDGDVDASDLATILGLWGSAGPGGDIDADGSVGAPDLAALLANWSG